MPSETVPSQVPPRRAYVLKMYPRFSETFIVSEILAREAAGEDIVIFSLRPCTDARFHPELARVQAPVIHVPRPSSAHGFWQLWQEAAADPVLADGTAENLGDLVGLDHDDAAQSLAVARLAREHGITHLHAHFASVATTVARAASLLTGIPYSFTTHAKDIFHDSVVTADLARKTADADHVVAISDFNRDYLRRRLGPVLAERIHVVRNGLELDRFPYRPRRPAGGVARLLAVGRLVEKKGFTHLLPALALLRKSGRDVRLDLVGTGPLEAELHEQITELGLADIVTMHGALTQREVTAMIDDHTALVAPFVPGSDGNVDGLPTVLLEGMAAGIPCVAGSVTAVPEIVIDGRTGWLVDGTDPDAIASAVAEVIGLTAHDPQSLRRITDAARDRVADLHDSRRQARALADLIDRPADDVDQPLEELEVAS
ncbi:glycosyltransferase family 4 protein [Brevibacterium casei]|uniref:Colanic acid biosynthesis glycosyltransferase WcaL n=2 Tax=Brevibacterium casei TaxID=33889 RepID=A0A269ZB99_9MICO|nr:glycosyltransferase family 4 protein [Brevibacterium casei]SII01613.1 group 1 glycosyl transferase [Mycobacteroides abscessus subsp. abscessus]MCT1446060.1 glycosyltransferase family 4 protein [Brevibacterium casei]MCT1764531.1 glycosyltransferase family 4 protein [Brevibacterium casei]MDH5149001.1 glycosyltransferase family 4 protein [Brevibacterium casei]PAK95077.1 colanic acid biosynthesis glycosyltransferase WcaL [Brevibacterium casei]